MCKEMKLVNTPVSVGEYLGMKMTVTFEPMFKKFTLTLKGSMSHSVDMGSDPSGNIIRINNALENMGKKLEESVTQLSTTEHQLETAKEEVQKPFPQEAELSEKLEKLSELNALLNMDEKGDDAVNMVDEPEAGSGEHQETDIEEMQDDDARAVVDDSFKPTFNQTVAEKATEYGKRMLADSSSERISVKEKLVEMRDREYGQKMLEKPEMQKNRGKEVIL